MILSEGTVPSRHSPTVDNSYLSTPPSLILGKPLKPPRNPGLPLGSCQARPLPTPINFCLDLTEVLHF